MTRTTHSLVTNGPAVLVVNEDEYARMKEKDLTVVVEPAKSGHPDSDTESQTPSSSNASPTKRGYFSQFPWIGAGALVGALVCSMAEFLSLYFAEKKAASQYLNGRLAPNVLLSIFSSLGNLFLTVAVGQGVAITWWRRALSGGTVRELQYSWSFSTSMFDIIKRAKYFNIIALAVLMAKISIIDGILYQRAIETYPASIDNKNFTADVTFFAGQAFPYTGTMGLNSSEDGLATWDYEVQILKWDQTGTDIYAESIINNCDGSICHFYLQGAGFALDCDTTSVSVDYGKQIYSSGSTSARAAQQDMTLFAVNFTRIWPSAKKNYSAITLEMVYNSEDDTAPVDSHSVCPMNLTKTTCELRPAVLKYKVHYTNASAVVLSHQRTTILTAPSSSDATDGTSSQLDAVSGVQLDYDCPGGEQIYDEDDLCGSYDSTWRQVQGVHVVDNADIVEKFEPGANSTLEGIFRALQLKLGANSQLMYNDEQWSVDLQGMQSVEQRNPSPEPGNCSFTFNNPMKAVLEAINTLTLMTVQNEELYYNYYIETIDNYTNYFYDLSQPLGGFDSSQAQNQTAQADVEYNDVFYDASPVFLYCALASTFVVVIFILPIFWGYWQLGRKVTLGPVEIARVFRGEAFEGVRDDNVDELIKTVGGHRIKYEWQTPSPVSPRPPI